MALDNVSSVAAMEPMEPMDVGEMPTTTAASVAWSKTPPAFKNSGCSDEVLAPAGAAADTASGLAADRASVEVSGLAWPYHSRQNRVAMSPDADGGFVSKWFATPDILNSVVHRFTFSADIGADAHVAKWIVRLETGRAESGLDRDIALCWWNGHQLASSAFYREMIVLPLPELLPLSIPWLLTATPESKIELWCGLNVRRTPLR
jgi:hypothetical protein